MTPFERMRHKEALLAELQFATAVRPREELAEEWHDDPPPWLVELLKRGSTR